MVSLEDDKNGRDYQEAKKEYEAYIKEFDPEKEDIKKRVKA